MFVGPFHIMNKSFAYILCLEICIHTIALQGFLSASTWRLQHCLLRPASRHLSCRAPCLLKHFSSESESFSEDDLARWDRMYQQGQASYADTEWEEGDMMMKSRKSEVAIVSFDLDNTLWKTHGCISEANDALAAFLDEHKIKQPIRVEKVMGELFLANKTKYSPIIGERAASATLLTLLRTDAIRQVLEDHNEYSVDDAIAFAEKAFEVWTAARHDAIPDNLVPGAVECLEEISNMKTSQGHPVLIGAVTDGNSDPRRVKMLEKYFDFCVNAESVGVSKPDKRVYLEAIRQVASHPVCRDLLTVESEDEDLEVGPYWVHVGDDFVKDIVPAKELKMRTVWATELIRDKLQDKLKPEEPDSHPPDDSDVGDFLKQISDKRVVEMSIGADDYLAESFATEFVDAVAEEFQHLSVVLTEWHAKAMLTQPTDIGETGDAVLSPGSKQPLSTRESNDGADILSVVVPDEPPILDSATVLTQQAPRVFRIIRKDCSVDVAAPLLNRESRTMKEVMGIAQMDKTSGVFAFAAADVEDMHNGKKVLMIKIEGTDLVFTREIFSKMTVQDVLGLTEENPTKLSLYMKQASSAQSFDLF